MDIKISNLSFSYPELPIFENLDMTIQHEKVTVILGPSGCGKTTLLNLISGVLHPESGSINKSHEVVLSYLFQETRLLPWMTVKQNIEVVLRNNSEKEKRVDHFLKELELYKFRNYYPASLSGGMKQRVSIARALAFQSNTLLMDEPFAGLDIALKINLFKMFNRAWKTEKRTTILVTHDIHEAILLGDEIIVLTERPVRIKAQFENKTPDKERLLSNPDILALEQKLYQLIS